MRFAVFVLAGLSAALPLSAASAQMPEVVHVSLTSYAFAPSTIAPEDKSKLEESVEIEVEANQSADITLTPRRAGTYR